MTWPFENDTSGIVKRISNRSISANRKRNIFIVLTIALASALLSAIVLYGFGVMQETQNRNQKTAQIMYHAISEQQGQELYKQEEIAWIGEFFNAFSEQVNHSTVNFTYANADMLKSQSMPYSGDLPASENEIVVQESFLDSLGYSNELGQTIQIPFSDGTTHDFKLTGILDVKTGDIGRYTAIISKELVRQQYGDGGMIDYYIGLKGAQNMSEEEATNYANTLAQQLKISDDNVIVRSTYFNLKDENHGSDMLFYFLIGFVTFIGSGIVIYSIFYISVASSIRNYGQLRTIGTTKRQIKKMVYREGKLLAAIAIPIGLVIGNVIGYFLIPAGWYWLTTLCVTVGVGLFAFIIVMIAIHTPVKRAASVSPLEALRYSDYQGKMKESSVLHRKITPASLAKMNLSRQKAKSTLTILSLSLGGVLVVLISTMLVSYDGVAEARGRAFPVGEFNIQLNANQSWDTAGISLSGLQQKNFLNADFINAVESIDGVTGIKHWYYTDAEYRVNGNSGKWIQGFCRDEQQNLEKERIAGTTDYDELVAGNGIVLLQERVFLILLVWMDGRNLSTLISKSEYNEKRPVGKKWILMVLIGIGVLVLGENQYQGSDLSYMYSHVIFIVGLFLVAAFGVALILEGLKHRKQFYHRHILQMNQLYSKYMNNLLILLILLVIHFFALTYLTVEIAEVLPLDKYRENYPYDMVWMAKEEDEAFAEKLVRKYDGNMTELPMIRVTTYYGAQHIGVSASEYEKLTGKDVNLSEREILVGIEDSEYQKEKKITDEDYLNTYSFLFTGKYQEDIDAEHDRYMWLPMIGVL